MEKAGNMNSELRLLLDLQELDIQIQRLEDQSRKLPGSIAALEQKINQSRAELQAAEEQLEELRKARRLKEGEVDALRGKLTKFKTQLMEVKTNKEYQAVLHEIAAAEQEIARVEDEILEMLLAADDEKGRVAELTRVQKEREREILAEKSELEKVAGDAAGELAQLRQRREQFATQVPQELNGQYLRIARARSGVALAEAKDGSCQMCHVRLRPQLFSEIKSNQRIITCDSCNRILYYAENSNQAS